MEKVNAVITGVGGYVPEYVLNNDELSRMVDTNDEWIMSRIGIKERRILNEEGLGTSFMARKAVKQLLEKTNTDPQEVDCLIVATTTPDYHFDFKYCYRPNWHEECLCHRYASCMLRFPFCHGCCCRYDTKRTI